MYNLMYEIPKRIKENINKKCKYKKYNKKIFSTMTIDFKFFKLKK